MTIDTKQLPSDIATLKKIVIEQQTNFIQYQKEIVKQRVKIVESENNLHKKENEIKYLKEQLAFFKKELFGRKSEKRKQEETQHGLFDEIEKYALNEEENSKETIKVKGYTKKKGSKKRGRKGLPAHLPRKKMIHDLPKEEIGQRRKIGEEVSEELVIVPEYIYVLRHIYYKYAPVEGVDIVEEEQIVKTAPRPPRLIPKSIASAGLLAYVLIAKFCDALPFHRQEKIFKRRDVDISRATMSNWSMLASKKCSKLMELIGEEILKGPILGIDETTLQVMNEPDRKNTTKSYMWVIRGGPPDKPYLIYVYRKTREAKFLLDLLKEYKGKMITDGYKAYDSIAKALNIEHAGCMDHVRREFVKVVNVSDGKSRAANLVLDLIGRLYDIENTARKNGLSPDELLKLRQSKSAHCMLLFKRWLDLKFIRVPPGFGLGNAIRYTLGQWNKLTRFLDDADIPLSNILVENAIRPFVIGRKNWMFSGSPRGASASAVFYSLIETAKANGLEPYWYLRYIFEKIPVADSDEKLRELLPSNLSQNMIRKFFKLINPEN